ncbi:MAG: cell division protein FtsZ [Verrucomicrobia bacterium]|nr:MAG: cell division protein FtsZ [Verrucomicrobiota bacterium]PYJ35123.1 MAG: cell division protein FtsZ [Verrucomicrobiota bacterium]
MIQLSKNYSPPDRLAEFVPVKVVSVGGAGLNALDRIVLDGLEKASVVAINTDVQSLTSSVAAHKVQLGRNITRGLGTGGDPELGYDAAVESADEIREALADARMIFVCAGLGGGTGSGAAPYVAQLAREAGALVIGFVTLPFTFEGKRRNAQARVALARLSEVCHSVICFENDRMGDLVSPQAGIHQAFAMADTTISQSVRSIVNLIQRPGLIRIGFDDLLAALRTHNGRCLFGFGEADSDNRAHDALTQALKNPLMDRGRMLADATNVLVQVAGGPGMTLSEVEVLMQELGRHVNEQTQILFGAVVDARLGDRLTVTIISSLAAEDDLISQPRDSAALSSASAQPPVREHYQHPQPQIHIEPEPALDPAPLEESVSFEEPVATETPPAPPFVPNEPEPLTVAPKKKAVPRKEEKLQAEKSLQAKQETLQFEPVTRGRFEKSEPTIVEGEDLDVPTYLRKNIKVK